MLDDDDRVELETIDDEVEPSWDELDDCEGDTCEMLE